MRDKNNFNDVPGEYLILLGYYYNNNGSQYVFIVSNIYFLVKLLFFPHASIISNASYHSKYSIVRLNSDSKNSYIYKLSIDKAINP